MKDSIADAAATSRRDPAAAPAARTTAERDRPADSLQNSARMTAQRRQIEAAFGQVAQRNDVPAEEARVTQAKAEPNRTGMPDALKAGVESLSGMDLSDVRVHANSGKPAQLNALAYAQGNEIHLGPGQEQHLAHEAWHVVQQRQGRVQPTMQMAGSVMVNDEPALEQEADAMGARAVQQHRSLTPQHAPALSPAPAAAQGAMQLVRAQLPPFANAFSLAVLEASIIAFDEQIAELRDDAEEVVNGFVDMEKIRRWRLQYGERIETLRGRNPGTASYTYEQISSGRRDATLDAFYGVLASLNNLRKALNDSLRDFNQWKQKRDAPEEEAYVYEDQYAEKNDPARKKEKLLEERRRLQAENAKLRKPGLGSKWGKYNEQLARKAQVAFHQHVPADAATIGRALASKNILDAVYHTDKAFWLADPGKFKLGSATGKALMVYTFSSEGARSLMEDYLLCGSGDFAEDNDEAWAGETAHPYHTIWKTNEIGAYGVGSARLAELAGQVVNIQAFGPDGNEIRP